MATSRPRLAALGAVRAEATATHVRVAVYGLQTEPPRVIEIHDTDRAIVVERVCDVAMNHCSLPVLAIRELIENLVHADFNDALVSIMDGGRTLRVSDRGTGLSDPDRAMDPGFTTADFHARTLIRGVGCGLSIAARIMANVGGTLELTDNLGGGLVATLCAPDDEAELPTADLSTDARHLLALLVEVGSARPEDLADELGIALPHCGRELSLLESRLLVSRAPDGTRTLTPDGSRLITSLF